MLEAVGILGALCILSGFYEVATGKWDGKSYRFEVVNLMGGMLLATYGVYKHAYANVLLNITFSAIALYAIAHTMQRYAQRKKRVKRLPRALSRRL